MQSPDGFEDLERFVFRKMADTKLPGLSISLVREGKPVYMKGFGYRDLASGLSATPDTIYCIGSVTKSFTCLAVMQLHEEGLLNIEDPVDEYISFKVRPMGEPIRIWHLMSHTSGIPALAYAEVVLPNVSRAVGKWLPISKYEDLLIFARDTEKWAHSKPGERWFYLNEGFILLGAIIEAASGEKYPDYVRTHVLEPLGMKRSYFRKEDVEKDPDVATPYVITDNERTPGSYPYGELLSDGGLISSASEMANYMEMLLNGGELGKQRIVSEEAVRSIMEPRAHIPEEPMTGQGHIYYGYGFRIKSDFLGRKAVYHSGSVYVSTAYMGVVPEERVGAAVLANGSGYFLEHIGEYALATLMGRDPMEVPALRREVILDDLTGTYETYAGLMSFKVTRRGGLMNMEIIFPFGSFNVPLIPVDIEGETKTFNSVTIDSTIPVEFFERDGEKYLIYDRYKLKKTSNI